MDQKGTILRDEDVERLSKLLKEDQQEEQLLKLAQKIVEEHSDIQEALEVADLPEDKYNELMRLVHEKRG
ncbi:MAG: hypothetical protein SV377_05765 [Halobacteria archaeon]|nr:hypothetical protein [Halobacteria archaeon]